MFQQMKSKISFWQPIKYFYRYYPYPAAFAQFLRNQPSPQFSNLQNGLCIATEEKECLNACIGFYIDAGSRYEKDSENGVAHFFEHIAFKGTKARTKTVLEDQMSNIGARFKCFTTREMVVYYVECLYQNVPLAFDILSDCIFNNSIADSDIELQKTTVYLEMLEHDKRSNDLMYDYLHTAAFQGTSLAQSVMGPTNNLHTFKNSVIFSYLSNYFVPNRMVVAAVGPIKHEQIVHLANTYITRLNPTTSKERNVCRYTGSEIRYRDDSMDVAHVAVAVEGPSFCDEDYLTMKIAAVLVGGWDRSQPGGIDIASRIARASSSGICDSFRPVYITYKDVGLWGVEFIAPKLHVDDILYIIQDKWMRLCNIITDAEVQRAKRELKTEILTKTENAAGLCHELGHWVLYKKKRPSLPEILFAIDRISALDIRKACTKYIYDKCPVVVGLGCIEGLPEYSRLRSGENTAIKSLDRNSKLISGMCLFRLARP